MYTQSQDDYCLGLMHFEHRRDWGKAKDIVSKEYLVIRF